MPSTRLLTVRQWTEQHPWPSLGGLRHLIFFSQSNGFAAVIRRVGRRIVIDEGAFFAWVAKQNCDGQAYDVGAAPTKRRGGK